MTLSTNPADAYRYNATTVRDLTAYERANRERSKGLGRMVMPKERCYTTFSEETRGRDDRFSVDACDIQFSLYFIIAGERRYVLERL
jgi:hypothetical protein